MAKLYERIGNRTRLYNIDYYKRVPRSVLSPLIDEQKYEVLRREGFQENETTFGSEGQFVRYVIDFLSTDKKTLKQAEEIFELIYNKANIDPSKAYKLYVNRMFKQVLNEVIDNSLTKSKVKNTDLNDLPNKILFWIDKLKALKRTITKRHTKPIKPSSDQIHFLKTKISEAQTIGAIDKILKKFEEENGYIAKKSKTYIAKMIVRNRKIANLVKRRANYTCQICSELGFSKRNGGRYAEVHHKDELSRTGLDLPSNMICVCPRCHRILHYGNLKELKACSRKSSISSTVVLNKKEL